MKAAKATSSTGEPDRKAVIFALPLNRRRKHRMRTTCGSLPDAFWSTGTPAV
ncbi:hypothetical protein ACLBOM_14440 [Escherichia coli]